MKCPRSAAVVMFLLLVACGGSSDNSDVKRTRPSVDYADYESQSQALHETWDATSFTDPATLPTNGSATYLGVVLLNIEQGADEFAMAGDIKLQVSFSDDQISGNAGNFVDEANTAYDGNLELTNGFLNRTADPDIDYTFQSDLKGTLTGGGENFEISTDLSGDFRGSDWGATTGLIQGSADSSSGTGYVFGEFIAAQ